MSQVASQKLLSQWFNAVDANRSGSIDAAELQRALKAGGAEFDISICQKICKFADINGDGKVTLDEFGVLHNFLARVQQSFLYFDRDRSASLDFQEAFLAVHHAGVPLSPEAFQTTFVLFDRDGNRVLSYPEYVEMMLYFQAVADDCRRKMAEKKRNEEIKAENRAVEEEVNEQIVSESHAMEEKLLERSDSSAFEEYVKGRR